MDRATQSNEIQITSEMISEGAFVLDSLRGVFDDYSLAAEVYKAMQRVELSQKGDFYCVPRLDKSVKLGPTRL
jgi:hypothetical protein